MMQLSESFSKRIGRLAVSALRVINFNDKHMREIVLGTSISFFMKFTGAGINFGFNAYLARKFGADGAGAYFIALSVATLSAMIGRAGLDNALLRYVASGASVGDWSLVRAVYKKGFLTAITLSIFVTICIYLSAPWVATALFKKESVGLFIKYIAFSILPVVLLTLYGEVLKGLKKIFLSQVVQGVGFQILCFTGLYVGSLYSDDGIVAIYSYIFSACVMAVIGALFWYQNIPRLNASNISFEYRRLMSSALPLFLVSALSLSYNWINTFFLGIWGTKSDVGVFSIAFRTSMLISFILVAVNTISAPKFAEIYKSGDIDLLANTARKTLRLMFFISTPIFLFFLVFASEIMAVFGDTFKDGADTLIVLSFAQYVNVVAGSVGYLLMMTGNEVRVRNSNFYSAVICIILSMVLVPELNFLGAGISISIALILRNAIEIYLVRKYLGVEIFIIKFSHIIAFGKIIRKHISI